MNIDVEDPLLRLERGMTGGGYYRGPYARAESLT
jgi:hypothetical protein